MIVDASALIAIVFAEPDFDTYASALAASPRTLLSAATFVEASVVVDSVKDPVLSRQFDRLLAHYGVVVEPVSVAQATIARDAYRDFGRGSGHPARLNFGDCFSYALAKDFDLPLLYKGDDFAQTDVRPAVP